MWIRLKSIFSFKCDHWGLFLCDAYMSCLCVFLCFCSGFFFFLKVGQNFIPSSVPNTFAPSPTPAPAAVSSGLNDLFELSTGMAITTGGYVTPKAVSSYHSKPSMKYQSCSHTACDWNAIASARLPTYVVWLELWQLYHNVSPLYALVLIFTGHLILFVVLVTHTLFIYLLIQTSVIMPSVWMKCSC